MSFLSRLFGGQAPKAEPGPKKPAAEAEHNGFRIQATPYPEGGQFQLAGIISKEVDGTVREHRFVRADKFPSIESAAEVAIAKARRIIDEQGDRLFG